VTRWVSPERPDEPDAAEAPGAAQPSGPARSATHRAAPRRGLHRRQNKLLAAAAAILVAAVVLILVVVLRDPDRPAPGSPEAVADDFATALRSGPPPRLAALACPDARAGVVRAANRLAGRVTSARRDTVSVVGGTAAVRLLLVLRGRSEPATVALSSASGTWCVSAFAP
jgi:hypothetical protein